MKLILAASRDFSDYSLFKESINSFLGSNSYEDVELVFGDDYRTCSIFELYALQNDYRFRKFQSNKKAYGNQAGNVRDFEIIHYADGLDKKILVAFWNGDYDYVLNLIAAANYKSIPTFIVRYNE